MGLKSLNASGYPPLDELELEFGERLTIITGDNGYGKSFILNLIFWQLSKVWTGRVYPHSQTAPKVSLSLDTGARKLDEINTRSTPQNSHLVLYAKSDGGFSTWDPAAPTNLTNLSEADVWNGDGTFPGIRSILDKVVKSGEKPSFLWRSLFDGTNPLLKLSASVINIDQINAILASIIPVEPFTLVTGNSQGVEFTFGTVPFDHASQATRRLFSLIFMLVKTIGEHQHFSTERGYPTPIERVIIMLDEPEAHLHPKWQRTVLPGIVQNIPNLHSSANAKFQFIVTSHAPLVLASIESIFQNNIDSIYTLEVAPYRSPKDEFGIPKTDADQRLKTIVARPFLFDKLGTADSWLASSLFKVEPMSIESEGAIKTAQSAMRSGERNPNALANVSTLLSNNLSADHPFLIEWNFYSDKFAGKRK